MKPSIYQNGARRKGFSFMEIMLVVVIIGILMAVVGPRLIGRGVDAQISATRQQMVAIKTALTAYEFTTGQLPTTNEGLEALVRRPSGVAEEDWEMQMEELPRDAWGEKFIYKVPGEDGHAFSLKSKGPDRQEGTDDDISLYKANRGLDD